MWLDNLIFPTRPINVVDVKLGQDNGLISKNAIACYLPTGNGVVGRESYGVLSTNWDRSTLDKLGNCRYCESKPKVGCYSLGPKAGALRIAVHEVRHRLQFNYPKIRLFGKSKITNLALAHSFRSALICFSEHKHDSRILAQELDAFTIEFLILRKIKLREKFSPTLRDILLMQPNGKPFSLS